MHQFTAHPNPSVEVDERPAFKRIKAHVLSQIQAGIWKEGDAIPSEQALASEFGVARMTANRALRELSDDRILVRVQGSGTFVASRNSSPPWWRSAALPRTAWISFPSAA